MTPVLHYSASLDTPILQVYKQKLHSYGILHIHNESKKSRSAPLNPPPRSRADAAAPPASLLSNVAEEGVGAESIGVLVRGVAVSPEPTTGEVNALSSSSSPKKSIFFPPPPLQPGGGASGFGRAAGAGGGSGGEGVAAAWCQLSISRTALSTPAAFGRREGNGEIGVEEKVWIAPGVDTAVEAV